MFADQIERTVRAIVPADGQAMRLAQAHLDRLTKPKDSLGLLESTAVRLAGITGKTDNRFDDKRVVIFAADHGVAAAGVSAFPQEVTQQMVRNFSAGGAAINCFCASAGAKVVCVDIGVAGELADMPGLIRRKVAFGTRNFCEEPAMSREQAEEAVAVGIGVARQMAGEGADLLATGEMGIANTTASSAVLAAYTGETPERVTGRGTGIDPRKLCDKAAVIRDALARLRPDPHDPLDVLRKVGGYELCGLAGLALGCAELRIPLVIDGFISTVAALSAVLLCPRVKDFLIASHLSEEPGHKLALERMELEAGLRFQMRLGEGTGAALMFPVIDAVGRMMADMATFASAGVAEKAEEQA